jgi:hypothetical protein
LPGPESPFLNVDRADHARDLHVPLVTLRQKRKGQASCQIGVKEVRVNQLGADMKKQRGKRSGATQGISAMTAETLDPNARGLEFAPNPFPLVFETANRDVKTESWQFPCQIGDHALCPPRPQHRKDQQQ